jgi:hypothetical protein
MIPPSMLAATFMNMEYNVGLSPQEKRNYFYISCDPIISTSTKECTCQVSFSLSNCYVICKYLGPPLTSKSSYICHVQKIYLFIYLVFIFCLIYSLYTSIIYLFICMLLISFTFYHRYLWFICNFFEDTISDLVIEYEIIKGSVNNEPERMQKE